MSRTLNLLPDEWVSSAVVLPNPCAPIIELLVCSKVRGAGKMKMIRGMRESTSASEEQSQVSHTMHSRHFPMSGKCLNT